MSGLLKNKIRWLAVTSTLSVLFLCVAVGNAYAQDDFSVGGFIDEDGDGFNDLLPDSDGDGVPDGLDPDSKIGMPDSGYMHRYMHNFQEQHRMMWENMNGDMSGHMEHGEPGMFGPGDSTGHGGHMGGGHHGGGGMGGGMDDGGGMGPGGGMEGGGGMDHGGGMGPDSEGGQNPGKGEGQGSTSEKIAGSPRDLKSPVMPENNERLKEKGDRGLNITPKNDAPGGK